jgi:hypothetical protein
MTAQGGVLEDFQCFADPKQVTFNNSADQPYLPQVRIMTCGYSSQCALNFAAYLFMKEKLGMNVTLYPTDEYDNVWNGEFWNGWADPLAYPKYYFEWLKNDSMDLNFEFWGTQLVRINYDGTVEFDGRTDFVLPGFIDIGYSGAFGEESIWMPQYYLDTDPYSIIPANIKNDAGLRTALISGSKDGPTDYYDEYNASRVETNWTNTDGSWEMRPAWYNHTKSDGTVEELPLFENGLYPTHDAIDVTKPIVWGSSASYFMTKYAYDLIQNAVPGGLDVQFVITGGEGSLAKLVRDLYTQRVPFLANIYTIDDNFGIIGNTTTGETQQFEKIAVERNPDQSLYDPCFISKRCQYPVAPILKGANPVLATRFPEAYDFYNNFAMGNRQLSKIISNYWQYVDNNAATGYTGTELWLHAVCDWLKDDDPDTVATWNNSFWMVDINRADCLQGCGVAATDGPLVGERIGGECNYYKGLCECAYDELFENQNCQQSCPGLQGPFWSTDTSEYYFNWCSGHGSCDTITRQCTCDQGFGGTGCQIVYEKYSFPIGLQVVIILFSCMLAIVCIGCIVWLRMSAEYKTVKALSVSMTTIMTVGLLMITLSNIALAMPISSASCIAWQWLFGLGGILSIMSPLLKAYRVSRVFHGGKMLRAVKITDKMLMATLIKCAAVEMVLCIAYAVFHEVDGGTTLYYNDEELRTEAKCNNGTITQYLLMASMAYFFIMLCALTKYSYGTRRALSVFKESTCAYFSSFLSLLCALIVGVFYMATPDPTFRTATQCASIILVVAAVLALFYGTRIYTFYTEPENRNVTDARATTNASSASTSVMKPGPQPAN